METMKNAVSNTANWLLDKGYRNILLEISNECDNQSYDHAIRITSYNVCYTKLLRDTGFARVERDKAGNASVAERIEKQRQGKQKHAFLDQ